MDVTVRLERAVSFLVSIDAGKKVIDSPQYLQRPKPLTGREGQQRNGQVR